MSRAPATSKKSNAKGRSKKRSLAVTRSSPGGRNASDLQLGMFAHEAVLFLATQFIGLSVAYATLAHEFIPVATAAEVVPSFLLSFFLATIVLVALLKYFKGGSAFKGLLAFLIFAGSEAVFATFIPELFAVILAIGLVILRFKQPTVLVQNATLVLAISGVGASLGLILSIPAVLIILAVLSVYDVIAVYKTKHMVTLFMGMVKKGVPFSLVIPQKVSDIHTKVQAATPGTGQFLMLGTGDIAFPLIFAVAALRVNFLSSMAVVVGSFIGIASIHFLLLSKKKGAIPALPPVVIPSLILFLITAYLTGGF